MKHATSSHPPKFGLGTSQSAQGSHRFQTSARRPAPAYDPSSCCGLADPEFEPGPLAGDEPLPSTSRGNATARRPSCGGLLWATSRLSCLVHIGHGPEALERPAGSLVAGRKWPAHLKERLKSCLCAAEDQGMHIVCALVGVDGLQVGDVAHDVILDLDAVAAVHVACRPRDIERLAAVVALDDGYDLGCRLAIIEQASGAQGTLQPECDLGLHIGELFLHELSRGEGPAELLALERVLASAMPAVLGRAHGPPS